MKATRILIALSVLVSGACNFDIADPNNPGPIGNDPSPSQVGAAVAGIVIAARAPVGGWNLISGILGREAYRFDGSEPRFISELQPVDRRHRNGDRVFRRRSGRRARVCRDHAGV
jgi:hypothetical protein